MQPAEYAAFKTLCLAASKSLGKLAIATQKQSTKVKTQTKQRRA
jgi:hypothetical protein